MLIVFVVDTSVSMGQRASSGLTLLDLAKCGAEHFQKIRGRDHSNRDLFMLVTCEETASAVKVDWKGANEGIFSAELKLLKAKDLSHIGLALRRAFDMLNQFRVQYGVDTYGQGRCSWSTEPGAVILLTDAGASVITSPPDESSGSGSSSGSLSISDMVRILPSTLAGAELTIDPFRWDQRLFSALLKFPAIVNNPSSEYTPATAAAASPLPSSSASALSIDSSTSIQNLCESTGGSCRTVTSLRTLLQYMEELAVVRLSTQSIGLVASFLPLSSSSGSSSAAAPQLFAPCLRRLIFPRFTNQIWPLPESYLLPSTSLDISLPPRQSHPMIRVSPAESPEVKIPELLIPCERFELEWCDIGRYMQANKMANRGCLYVYMMNSSSSNPVVNSPGEPFGFIQLKTTPVGNPLLMLTILPYNFPKLFQLLDEVYATVQRKNGPAVIMVNEHPSSKWRQEWDQYVQSIPPYYLHPLRFVAKKWPLSAASAASAAASANAPGGGGSSSNPSNPSSTLPFPIPESLDNAYIFTLTNILKRFKQLAKIENDAVIAQQQQDKSGSSQPSSSSFSSSPLSVPQFAFDKLSSSSSIAAAAVPHVSDFRQLFKHGGPASPSSSSASPSSISSSDYHIPTPSSSASSSSSASAAASAASPFGPSSIFKNPANLTANQLLVQLDRMKLLFFGMDLPKTSGPMPMPVRLSSLDSPSPLASGSSSSSSGGAGAPSHHHHHQHHVHRKHIQEAEDGKHSVPVAQMGNFMDVLAKKPLLRDPYSDDEGRSQFRPSFGNPYKKQTVSKSPSRPSSPTASPSASPLSSPISSPSLPPASDLFDEAEEESVAFSPPPLSPPSLGSLSSPKTTPPPPASRRSSLPPTLSPARPTPSLSPPVPPKQTASSPSSFSIPPSLGSVTSSRKSSIDLDDEFGYVPPSLQKPVPPPLTPPPSFSVKRDISSVEPDGSHKDASISSPPSSSPSSPSASKKPKYSLPRPNGVTAASPPSPSLPPSSVPLLPPSLPPQQHPISLISSSTPSPPPPSSYSIPGAVAATSFAFSRSAFLSTAKRNAAAPVLSLSAASSISVAAPDDGSIGLDLLKKKKEQEEDILKESSRKQKRKNGNSEDEGESEASESEHEQEGSTKRKRAVKSSAPAQQPPQPQPQKYTLPPSSTYGPPVLVHVIQAVVEASQRRLLKDEFMAANRSKIDRIIQLVRLPTAEAMRTIPHDQQRGAGSQAQNSPEARVEAEVLRIAGEMTGEVSAGRHFLEHASETALQFKNTALADRLAKFASSYRQSMP